MRATRIDLTGERFGRLTVAEFAGNDKRGEARWRCVCDCGNESIVLGSHLRKERVQSCGCLKNEMAAQRLKEHPTRGNFKHGGTHTRLYMVWVNMKTRCLNKNNRAYKWYGALGVSICEEWMSFEKFRQWAEESGYRDDLSIDRINPYGNYEPSNCRWIPLSEQRGNQRRSAAWQCLS